jgi:hypothetical protein
MSEHLLEVRIVDRHQRVTAKLGGKQEQPDPGYGLAYWVHAMAYPINIGGKPLNSWPQFIPVTFELTILIAALSAVLGMILLNGLPMPYHPVFNVPRFEHASRDKFFLLVESNDPKFDRQKTAEFLKGLDASEVNEVEP